MSKTMWSYISLVIIGIVVWSPLSWAPNFGNPGATGAIQGCPASLVIGLSTSPTLTTTVAKLTVPDGYDFTRASEKAYTDTSTLALIDSVICSLDQVPDQKMTCKIAKQKDSNTSITMAIRINSALSGTCIKAIDIPLSTVTFIPLPGEEITPPPAGDDTSLTACTADNYPDIADTDGDSEPDACDTDVDNDGVANESDVCPFVANPDQGVSADGVGLACGGLDDGCVGIECNTALLYSKGGGNCTLTPTHTAQHPWTIGWLVAVAAGLAIYRRLALH